MINFPQQEDAFGNMYNVQQIFISDQAFCFYQTVNIDVFILIICNVLQ